MNIKKEIDNIGDSQRDERKENSYQCSVRGCMEREDGNMYEYYEGLCRFHFEEREDYLGNTDDEERNTMENEQLTRGERGEK